eukprot:364364-Chlamydomonas_euryale.AAC.3
MHPPSNTQDYWAGGQRSELYELTVDPRRHNGDGRAVARVERLLDDQTLEFPVVAPSAVSRRHTHVYAVGDRVHDPRRGRGRCAERVALGAAARAARVPERAVVCTAAGRLRRGRRLGARHRRRGGSGGAWAAVHSGRSRPRGGAGGHAAAAARPAVGPARRVHKRVPGPGSARRRGAAVARGGDVPPDFRLISAGELVSPGRGRLASQRGVVVRAVLRSSCNARWRARCQAEARKQTRQVAGADPQLSTRGPATV